MTYDPDIKKLVGKFIKKSFLYQGDIYMTLGDDSVIALVPLGECCAQCYINGVDSSEALFDAQVLEVESLEIKRPEKELHQYHDVLDAWGHRIHTTKGICTIDMRLSHNGYYSGQLYWEDKNSIPKDAKTLKDWC